MHGSGGPAGREPTDRPAGGRLSPGMTNDSVDWRARGPIGGQPSPEDYGRFEETGRPRTDRPAGRWPTLAGRDERFGRLAGPRTDRWPTLAGGLRALPGGPADGRPE